MFEDIPKLLGNPKALETRFGQLNEPHIAPLTEFVRGLRDKMGPDASIPYFDPWDGGVAAELLFLLEAPGPKARNSGFISLNNPDGTAKNFFELSAEAGISRKRVVIWNAVPWYIGSGTKIRPASSSDIMDGIESLEEFINLLPSLRVVVLVGGKAQKAEKHISKLWPTLIIQKCPHPSPLFVNRLPGNRQVLLGALKAVQKYLGEV